jgi:hypothetical protein
MARLHCVPLRNAKRLPHKHVEEIDQPTPAQTDALPINQNRRAEKPKSPSLNYHPGCLKVVDTFRLIRLLIPSARPCGQTVHLGVAAKDVVPSDR